MSGEEADEKTACNGYTADDSSGNACSNGVETDSSFNRGVRKSHANDIGPGFIVDVEGQKKNHLHHHAVYPSRRRQQQQERSSKQLLKELAKSPIHPDIDISLTGHVMGTNVLQQGKQLPASEENRVDRVGFEQCQQVDALSHLLVDYFGAMRTAGMQQQNTPPTTPATDAKDERTGDPVASKAVPEEKVEPDGGKRKRSASTTRKKTDPKPTQTSNTTNNKETPLPYPLPSVPGQSVPQIIADECKPSTRTTFSSKLRRLEEALELTHTPRMLIEASFPHRVVHTNAAFSSAVIKNSSNNIQRWMEKQNSPTIPETRTLSKALDDMIPETTAIPLSVYPVHGSTGTVSHYLIEPSCDASPSRKRRRFEDIPSQAIG